MSSSWLDDHLSSLSLSEEAEGYLLGRGMRPETIERLGVKEWTAMSGEAPDYAFRHRYRARGEALEGTLIFPLRSPSGVLTGIEARSRFEKRITDYRLPEAEWCPMGLNLPRAAEALWEGGSAWIVEGVFDLAALEWAIPQEDAVIATLRAALGRDIVTFLSRFCRNAVYMVYDNDETGRKATLGWNDAATGKRRFGAMENLARAGLRAVDFRYRGKDPGEVWRAGGKEALLRTFSFR